MHIKINVYKIQQHQRFLTLRAKSKQEQKTLLCEWVWEREIE